jgi:hypothetical protein
MPEPRETGVLAIRCYFFTSKSMHAPPEPTTKLARVFAGWRASLLETGLRSFSQPDRGFCSLGSKQTSGAQLDEPGGTLYATPSLSH